MKLTAKIFLSLFILLILIVVEEFYIGLGVKSWIKYERTHVKNVDISFLSLKIREKLIKIISKNIENMIINNTSYIDIINGEIKLYDLNRNILSENSLSIIELKNIIKELQISYLQISIDNDGNLKDITMSISKLEYLYNYSSFPHNYSEGYIIPVSVGRVEKVIDNNWYVLRFCDRIICQEPQR